jgi:WD40 repeat protein
MFSFTTKPSLSGRGQQHIGLGAVVAALVLATAVHGQPVTGRVGKDQGSADGVPLPDGAIVRLGSARFRHDGQPVEPVVFSPDGRLLASAHTRGVSVFDVATGRALHHFRVTDKQYPRIARFLSDGKHVAVGSMGNRVADMTVYALADGKPTATTKFDTTGKGNGHIKIIDVTANGLRVLVDDLWGRGIYLRDLKSGKDVWRFEVSDVVSTHPFTADGKWLAVATKRKVELRDSTTGKVAAVFPDPGPNFGDLFSATLARDGKAIAVSKGYDALAVLDAKGPVPVRTFQTDPGLEGGHITPDGRYLIGLRQVVTLIWDLTDKDAQGPVARLPGAMAVGFAPDGKTLALSDHGFVTLWTVGDWKPLSQSADPPSLVHPVRFALDGERVLGHTRAGWLNWPTAGGPPTRPSADSAIHLAGHADVSADGRVAVEAVYVPGDKREQGKSFYQVTDLTTGAVRRVPRDGSSGKPPRLSPDGRFVSADFKYQDFGVWRMETGELLHRQSGSPKGIILAASPAADGKGLALSLRAAYRDDRGFPRGPQYSSVTVTDHRTERAWALDPLPPSVPHASFSPDGSRLVVQSRASIVSDEGDVSVWDVRAGRRLMAWPRRPGITGLRETIPDLVALSRDNRSLLVGDAAGRLTLIEVATGKERTAFQHAGGVLSVAFHPDGSKAVSSSLDGPVFVWNLLGTPSRWDLANADALWTDLASDDAKTAFAAVCKLRTNSAQAIDFLRDRIKLPAVPSEDTVADLLRRLDGPRFADREKALKELTEIADLIRPRLEAARKGATAEAGRRLDEILKAADKWTPDRLRYLRACEVLEGIGTTDAQQVLRTWASGPAGAVLTTEATQSLDRQKR